MANEELRVSPETKLWAQRSIKKIAALVLVLWAISIGIWYLLGADEQNFWPSWGMWIFAGVVMVVAWAAFSPAKGE
jgi:hypothetical protein